MADDSLYFLDTIYNSSRDAWEINIGYMVHDEDVKGRYKSLKITVNIPEHRKEEDKAKEIAIGKARDLLRTAAEAPVEDD
jgi:hypothetical protein